MERRTPCDDPEHREQPRDMRSNQYGECYLTPEPPEKDRERLSERDMPIRQVSEKRAFPRRVCSQHANIYFKPTIPLIDATADQIGIAFEITEPGMMFRVLMAIVRQIVEKGRSQ